jgi:hypothetical protein
MLATRILSLAPSTREADKAVVASAASRKKERRVEELIIGSPSLGDI